MADFYRFTPNGLVTDRKLSRSEYAAIGVRLGSVYDGTRWAIGDWMLIGKLDPSLQTEFSEAAKITGLSFDSLSQSLRVSMAYEKDERVAGASWTHHRACLPLSITTRKRVLSRAVRHSWTATQTFSFVAEHRDAITCANTDTLPAPEREPKHRRKRDGWRLSAVRKPLLRTCPECGHTWDVRSTAGTSKDVGTEDVK